MMLFLAAFAALFALLPAVIFLRNLPLYRPLPRAGGDAVACSVLIPARNEEAKVAAALESVLGSEKVDLEVLVLDDHSSDGTAAIVRQIAARDARVRLLAGAALPAGWCGKNFACQQLAEEARHPLLLFLDADVRVCRADALAGLAEFVRQSGAGLVSAVPREETRTFLEQLVIPLIHFVLLGFLPLRQMRTTTDPRFAAACGQVLAVRRESYLRVGGHGAVRGFLHDAVALAREFRREGEKTDLFDGTASFTCRMYGSAAEVWNGFAKNAHEGLGSPRLIVPSTLLLLGGQVLPFLLLGFATSRLTIILAALAAAGALLPRCIGIIRFRQSLLGAVLHPLGALLLVAIQWSGLVRAWSGRGTAWKGRDYLAAKRASGARLELKSSLKA